MASVAEKFTKHAPGVDAVREYRTNEFLHVYHGELEGHDEEVRFLTLAPDIADEGVHATFERVAGQWRNAATHPNIVSIYDYGQTPRPWLAVETVDGQRLDATHLQLTPAEVRAVVTDAAEAVRNAGLYNTRHLDLTPDSIWVVENPAGPRALVDGWGLERACHVAAGETSLSPYMAPELAESPDGGTDQTDVYGLGAVAYYGLTGQPPVEDVAELETTGNSGVPPASELNPDVPAGVDEVLGKALATTPAQRYQSSYDFKQAFVRVLSDENLARPLSDVVADTTSPGTVSDSAESTEAADSTDSAEKSSVGEQTDSSVNETDNQVPVSGPEESTRTESQFGRLAFLARAITARVPETNSEAPTRKTLYTILALTTLVGVGYGVFGLLLGELFYIILPSGRIEVGSLKYVVSVLIVSSGFGVLGAKSGFHTCCSALNLRLRLRRDDIPDWEFVPNRTIVVVFGLCLSGVSAVVFGLAGAQIGSMMLIKRGLGGAEAGGTGTEEFASAGSEMPVLLPISLEQFAYVGGISLGVMGLLLGVRGTISIADWTFRTRSEDAMSIPELGLGLVGGVTAGGVGFLLGQTIQQQFGTGYLTVIPNVSSGHPFAHYHTPLFAVLFGVGGFVTVSKMNSTVKALRKTTKNQLPIESDQASRQPDERIRSRFSFILLYLLLAAALLPIAVLLTLINQTLIDIGSSTLTLYLTTYGLTSAVGIIIFLLARWQAPTDQVERTQLSPPELTKFDSPRQYLRDNPIVIWSGACILGLLTVLVGLMTGNATLSFESLQRGPFIRTFYLLYLPLFVTLVPVTAFSWWHRRHRRQVSESLVETLLEHKDEFTDENATLNRLDELASDPPSEESEDTNCAVVSELGTLRDRLREGKMATGCNELADRYRTTSLRRLATKIQESDDSIEGFRTGLERTEQTSTQHPSRIQNRLHFVTAPVSAFLFGLVLLSSLALFSLNYQFIFDVNQIPRTATEFSGGLDIQFIIILLFHMSTIQAIFFGLYTGYSKDGYLTDGYRFVLAFSSVTLLTWYVVLSTI